MGCEQCQLSSLCRDKGKRGSNPKCLREGESPKESHGRYEHGAGSCPDDEVYPYRSQALKRATQVLEEDFHGHVPVPRRSPDGRSVLYKDKGVAKTLRVDTDNPSTILPLAGSVDVSSQVLQPNGKVKKETRHFGWSRD